MGVRWNFSGSNGNASRRNPDLISEFPDEIAVVGREPHFRVQNRDVAGHRIEEQLISLLRVTQIILQLLDIPCTGRNLQHQSHGPVVVINRGRVDDHGHFGTAPIA